MISALWSGGMGAETRGDIAAHGQGRLGRAYVQGDLAAEGDSEGPTCISES